MDRKEFLKGCAGGLCACAAACLSVPASGAEAEAKEDWRLPFVRQRYAKLLDILTERMSREETAAALRKLGAYCGDTMFGGKFTVFSGMVDSYAKFMAQASAGKVTVERAGGAYRQTYDPGTDCSCPFVGRATPGVVCECTLGWHRHVWSQVLGRESQVTLKESVLRGGKRCVVEIRPV